MRGGLHWVARAVLAGPPIAVTVLMVWISVAERAGAMPFAAPAAANPAEAAAMGNAVDLVRFLRFGADPHRVYPVRTELISSAVPQATTLEAAIWSRQVELVQFLDAEGAIVGGDQRRALACLAADLGVEDVVDYLAPQGAAACTPGEALARVAARTGEDAHE